MTGFIGQSYRKFLCKSWFGSKMMIFPNFHLFYIRPSGLPHRFWWQKSWFGSMNASFIDKHQTFFFLERILDKCWKYTKNANFMILNQKIKIPMQNHDFESKPWNLHFLCIFNIYLKSSPENKCSMFIDKARIQRPKAWFLPSESMGKAWGTNVK